MSRFFIRRPIVAIVIAILFVIGGAVMVFRLPVAQFPEIAPPQIETTAVYTGCRRAHRRAVGGDADRRAGERREAHDLHAGDLRERRHDDAPGLVRDRHGHRHRPGAGPEPPGAGAGQPADRGEQLRPHDDPDGGHPAARLHDQLAEADVGPELPLELRRDQRQGRAVPRSRDRAGQDLRRGELRHARVGRAGHDREARAHGDRPRERHHGAERRESRGHARRRAGAARPAVHVHGAGARPPDERRGVRRRDRARERGRIARPLEGRRPPRARRRELHPAGVRQRCPGDARRPLPGSRVERARCRQSREGHHGAPGRKVPVGHERRADARHDGPRDGGREGDRHHAARGDRARHPGRVRLPPELAGHAHPDPHHSGVPRRHLRVLPDDGVLDEHAVAPRARARGRPRRRRRDRRRRGDRGEDRGGPVPARCGAPGDGGGERRARRHRARAVERVHPRRVHRRHHRLALPAVRAHHRVLGPDLGLQCAHAQPRARRADPPSAAEGRAPRTARTVLRRVRSRLRGGADGLRPRPAPS